MTQKRHTLSLKSYGTRRHLTVAMTLVTVLPLLSFLFIAIRTHSVRGTYAIWTDIFVSLASIMLAITGYVMLRRYPKDIETLRDHLKSMADGELPDRILLRDDTDDAGAIAYYLKRILDDMRIQMKRLEDQLAISERMQQTIREQEQRLREADQRRVMIESLATACHHISQPATVLRLYLDSMAQKSTDEATNHTVEECRHAIAAIANILDRLRQASNYRTLPYIGSTDDEAASARQRILDI